MNGGQRGGADGGRGISSTPQSRTTHIDVAGALRHLGRALAGAARRPPAAGRGRAPVAIAVAVAGSALLGCGGEGGGGAPAPDGAASAVSSRDPSGSPASSLRAALTAQLEARVHLLSVRGAALAAGDDEGAGGLEDALGARRVAIEAVLSLPEVRDVDDLLQVLADQDDLLRDQAVAETASEERRARNGLTRSAARLAVVAESMTGGRLPEDVAAPLASTQLRSLLAVDEARRQGGGAAAAVALDEALVSEGRLLDPFLLALGAELGLEGASGGDAAQLRADLTSMLLQHGFGAVEVALGAEGGDELVTGATERLSAWVAASYGTEVAGAVVASWSDQVAATDDAVLAAVALRRASGSPRRVAARRAATVAEHRSDEAIAALAALLAGTTGDEAVAPAVRASLHDHRAALDELLAAPDGGPEGSWPAAADAALELSDLSTVLASAVTRQKSLA